jgi:hypothetical protein
LRVVECKAHSTAWPACGPRTSSYRRQAVSNWNSPIGRIRRIPRRCADRSTLKPSGTFMRRRIVERASGDLGEDLDTACAEILDRARASAIEATTSPAIGIEGFTLCVHPRQAARDRPGSLRGRTNNLRAAMTQDRWVTPISDLLGPSHCVLWLSALRPRGHDAKAP